MPECVEFDVIDPRGGAVPELDCIVTRRAKPVTAATACTGLTR